MSLQHILMGLLKEQPSSGYDLNKRLEEVGQHFWVTEQSQVYRALYKMLQVGYVEYETIIQESSPNKKVYKLTQEGVEEFEQWIRSPQSRHHPVAIWLAQLYLGDTFSESDVKQLLESWREDIDARLAWARQRSIEERKIASVRSDLRSLSIEYYVTMLEAEKAWIDSAFEQVDDIYKS